MYFLVFGRIGICVYGEILLVWCKNEFGFGCVERCVCIGVFVGVDLWWFGVGGIWCYYWVFGRYLCVLFKIGVNGRFNLILILDVFCGRKFDVVVSCLFCVW